MEIRAWRSYSCNNSSSYRLVAKFSDGKVIQEAAKELAALFKKHAKEQDEYFDENDEYLWNKPTKAALDFAKAHGFAWKSGMTWGDEMQEGDEPEIFAEANSLILYHSYCGGGLPKEVAQYLEHKGGKVDKAPKGIVDRLYVSVIARLPRAGVKAPIKKELDRMYTLSEEDQQADLISGYPPPWKGEDEVYGQGSYFCDGKTFGFFCSTSPRDLDTLKKWLKKHGAVDPIIRINEWGDLPKFKAIASARCTECDGALEYLDPRVTKIDTEQLACGQCGGMFDLTTFMGKKVKKPTKTTPPSTAPAPKKSAAKKKVASPKKSAAKKKVASPKKSAAKKKVASPKK